MMLRRKGTYFLKAISIVLIIALMMPIGAVAAEQNTVTPRASYYLAGYTAYICAMGNSDLEIWFEVTGTDFQEYLGVLTIYLYESTDNVNWYWVETFLHEDNPQMLRTNVYFNIDHVDYDGVAGRYYKAYVGIWGGPDDTGDARYIWTSVERAT